MKISSQIKECLEKIHNSLNEKQCFFHWSGYVYQDDFDALMELNRIVNIYFIKGTTNIKFEYDDLQKKKFKEFYNELLLKDDFS